jgi:NADH:ubiquinone oxidoreductase subunit E
MIDEDLYQDATAEMLDDILKKYEASPNLSEGGA